MKIKLDTFWLKIIALICMVIDHIGHNFVLPIMNNSYPVDLNVVELYYVLRTIGRLAFPIFCFCFVEGFKRTSNKKKYGLRLLTSATIMCLGNSFLTFITKGAVTLEAFSPNIFATFFVMFLVLCLIEEMLKCIKKEKVFSPILLGILWTLLSLIVIKYLEYGIIAVFVILCFYSIDNRKHKILTYIIGSIILCLIEGNVIQIGMIFASIPLWLYTSKKPKYKAKSLFYVFYPVHIWMFALIEALC